MNDTIFTPREFVAADILLAVYLRGFREGAAVAQARPTPLPTVPPEEQEKAATLSLSTSVTELGLKHRVCTLIQGDGIHTIGDLMGRSEEELMDIRNFAEISLQEVRDKLAHVGYIMRPV